MTPLVLTLFVPFRTLPSLRHGLRGEEEEEMPGAAITIIMIICIISIIIIVMFIIIIIIIIITITAAGRERRECLQNVVDVYFNVEIQKEKL